MPKTLQLNCQVFVNGAYKKNQRILVPQFSNEEYANIQSIVGQTYYQCQGLLNIGATPYSWEWREPFYDGYSQRPLMKEVCDVRDDLYIWEFLDLTITSGQRIEYKILNSNNRKIVIDGHLQNDSDNKLWQFVGHIKYYIDTRLIFETYDGYFMPGNWWYSQWNEHWVSTGFHTLPWLSTDGDKIYNFAYSGRGLRPHDPAEEIIFSTDYSTGYIELVLDGGSSTTNPEAFAEWLEDYDPPEYDPEDPFSPGGTSGKGGGDGNFEEDSDKPEKPLLPTSSAVGTGFATIFTPSAGQLHDLSGLFWNSNFFTFMQNLVENITDMFLSLAMVPFTVPAGNTVTVRWIGIDTGIALPLASQQFLEFNMGSIDMRNDSRIFRSGSCLDYSPFSQLGIFLPFIGYRELDVDECRDCVVNLRYRIDLLSGTAVAIISLDGSDIYEFVGNCLTQIPLTNQNMESLVQNAVAIGTAAAIASSGGAVAAADKEVAAGMENNALAEAKIAHANAHVTQSASHLASATANAAIGMKPSISKTGSISGAASLLGVRHPYLFLKTPRQSLPENYQRYYGFPSNITETLGNLHGYTVVEDIRLNDLVATSEEIAEIYQLLKSGVII